jgi:hypothetical protein
MFRAKFRKRQFSAILSTWHGGCNNSCMTDGMVRRSPRRLEMTLSFNVQKLALSVFGALVASSLFLAAAVGPVPVI